MRNAFRGGLYIAVAMAVAGGAWAESKGDEFFDGGTNQCTIDFDELCPDAGTVCATRVSGGSGCVVDGLAFCYESGMFSYRVDAGDKAQFSLRRPVDQVEVFFAQAAEGTGGQMAFFDVDGLQVGDAITTNGVCSIAMPATQTVIFDRPVVRIRVRALDTDIYIDSLSLIRN